MKSQLFVANAILGATNHVLYPTISSETLDYMAENNIPYVYQCRPPVAPGTHTILTDASIADTAIADIQTLTDMDIPVWLEVEGYVYDAGRTVYGWIRSTTVEEYEAVFGECMALFDDTDLVGYGAEGMFDGAALWLSGHATGSGKLMSQRYWGGSGGYPVVPLPDEMTEHIIDGIVGASDMRYVARRELADQWIWEAYTLNEVQWSAAMEAWTATNHPELHSKPWGITTAVSGNATDNNQWWSDTLWPADGFAAHDTVIFPLSQQQILATQYLIGVLFGVGIVPDVLEFIPTDPTWIGGNSPNGITQPPYNDVGLISLIEQMQWWEGLLSQSIATEITAATELNTLDITTTIYGSLDTTEDIPLSNVTVGLQKDVSGTWTDITTTVTDVGGEYQFNDYETAIGNYNFRTTYAGSTFFDATTSDAVVVDVAMLIRLKNMAYPT